MEEKMNNSVYCTNCKKELTDNDEVLVLEFDFQYEENIFCSAKCLIKSLEDWGDVGKTTASDYSKYLD